jgi:hypothetical protein
MLTSRGGLQALELADEGPNGGVVIEHGGSQQIQQRTLLVGRADALQLLQRRQPKPKREARSSSSVQHIADIKHEPQQPLEALAVPQSCVCLLQPVHKRLQLLHRVVKPALHEPEANSLLEMRDGVQQHQPALWPRQGRDAILPVVVVAGEGLLFIGRRETCLQSLKAQLWQVQTELATGRRGRVLRWRTERLLRLVGARPASQRTGVHQGQRVDQVARPILEWAQREHR